MGREWVALVSLTEKLAINLIHQRRQILLVEKLLFYFLRHSLNSAFPGEDPPALKDNIFISAYLRENNKQQLNFPAITGTL
ncbi:hypothetical protein GCM10009413_01020 [Tatumella punctata]